MRDYDGYAPVHRCSREGCEAPIGDGDYVSGKRQCAAHRPRPRGMSARR